MAKDGRIYDGSVFAVAMDADANPSNLPDAVDSICVNRIMRGGIRTQRPPFRQIKLTVREGENPELLEDFKKGNFQGAFAYRSIKYGNNDGLAVAIAGKIYFITIVNNVGYVKLLIDGNDPTLMHTWFVQAEDWLYIQNGKQNPIAWDGDATGKPSNLQARGLNSPSTDTLYLGTTSRERTGGFATITLVADHDYAIGDYVQVVNATDNTFNGIYKITNIPAANRFTYQNPGANVGATADIAGLARKYLGEIRLTWVSNSPSATGFEIQQRINVLPWTTIATVPVTQTQYDVTGVNVDNNYAYRVRAVFGTKSVSPWSNVTEQRKPNNTVETPELALSISRLNPAAQEMPIGTIMEYAYGRVWVSDKRNNIYASDIIYGEGFTETSNTRNFTEQTYWAEGGSFTPPAQLGNITGMKVMPYIGANTRGQGELVVMCDNGAFTLDGSIPRTQWIDSNIQRVALLGRGNTSPYALASVNNELIFRSDDGWSLFTNSQSEFFNKLSYRKLSREVNLWVDKDTKWMRQFASAMFFDNRIICTVSPYTESPQETGIGLHRPHRGLVVVDLDQTTASSPDSETSFRWNGLWTGPNPTQVLTAQIRGEQRAFIFSFDNDGNNRLFELMTSGADDFVEDQSKQIKSYFITKKFNFSSSEQTNIFYNKELNGGDMSISDIAGEGEVTVSYRPDSYPCWNNLLATIKVGCDQCGPIDCNQEISENRCRKIRFFSPPDECQSGNNQPTNYGTEFQLLVECVGSMKIDRFRISSDTRGSMEDPTGTCPEDPQNCEIISCCPMPDFDYYKLID